MSLSLLGIILGLILIMAACMKGMSILIAAPISSMVVAAFSGYPLLETFLETYMDGTVGYVFSFFPMFFLGAIFGKIMEDTGAAAAVASWVMDKIGSDKAILAVVLACMVLTYGGISLFVVVFTMYPLGMAIFKEANVPKRFIAGSIAFGSFTITMTATPGTPQIQNIIPTEFFGTDAMSAPFLGLAAAVLIFLGGYFYLQRELKKAWENGEEYSEGEDEDFGGNDEDLPGVLRSILPLISVVVLLNVFGIDINGSLFWGNALALILLWDRFDYIMEAVNTLNEGADGSLTAIMNTSMAVGFGTVVQEVPGFDELVEVLADVTLGNVYLFGVVSTNVLAGATGSASGGMSIALEALADTFLDMGGNPELLHRTIAIASGGLDVLPHNGAVITLLVVTGLTHDDAYKDIFVTALLIPAIVGLLSVIPATIIG
ncbi:GntP family permease [Halarsenatibacter silvermanii]|uniref:H+/gluconate symporter n=1 Tax=Halarsenatibacter silvermanii TaxID=321763 RepID=A0A1G9R6C3_9FIRM|nr:GntP family permease [Halarsenatibacter silvermanii]SDM18794.1 H+/gluconate symporter [Halarsenatibacter silvermanii]